MSKIKEDILELANKGCKFDEIAECFEPNQKSYVVKILRQHGLLEKVEYKYGVVVNPDSRKRGPGKKSVGLIHSDTSNASPLIMQLLNDSMANKVTVYLEDGNTITLDRLAASMPFNFNKKIKCDSFHKQLLKMYIDTDNGYKMLSEIDLDKYILNQLISLYDKGLTSYVKSKYERYSVEGFCDSQGIFVTPNSYKTLLSKSNIKTVGATKEGYKTLDCENNHRILSSAENKIKQKLNSKEDITLNTVLSAIGIPGDLINGNAVIDPDKFCITSNRSGTYDLEVTINGVYLNK